MEKITQPFIEEQLAQTQSFDSFGRNIVQQALAAYFEKRGKQELSVDALDLECKVTIKYIQHKNLFQTCVRVEGRPDGCCVLNSTHSPNR